MTHDHDPPRPPAAGIGDISTSWRRLNDPLAFFLTYGSAVRNYLSAILKNPDEADEVLQDLLVQVTESGFRGADPTRGRFRPYLKAVVRNAALKRLRRTRRPGGGEVDDLPDDATPDRAWRDEWRRCVLDKAWRALERHQRAAKGNLAYTVLRLAVDHPDDDSPRLAARAAAAARQPLTPEAFRKQLSRARRAFADLIADEVRQTLDDPSPADVRDELADLDLLDLLRGYLSDPG